MARATKSSAIGRGDALPALPAAFDMFVVENSADPIGEPDGLYYTYLTSWLRDSSGNSGGASSGSSLPDPATTIFDVFVLEGSADPVGEPDGLYYRTAGGWLLNP